MMRLVGLAVVMFAATMLLMTVVCTGLLVDEVVGASSAGRPMARGLAMLAVTGTAGVGSGFLMAFGFWLSRLGARSDELG